MAEKKLAGKKLVMTYANNRTPELWRSFMPRRKEVKNNVDNNLISMQVYGPGFDFNRFDPHKEFVKWAAIEVTGFDNVPAEMETYVLPAGLYAVFLHKGSSTDLSTVNYIFGEWLPHSDYVLDQRPHFELLGEKYKNADPASEEEFWIPVKKAF